MVKLAFNITNVTYRRRKFCTFEPQNFISALTLERLTPQPGFHLPLD
jgi:hypothetical protein